MGLREANVGTHKHKTGSGPWKKELHLAEHDEFTDGEAADVKAAAQQGMPALDTWYTNQGGTRAAWWAVLSPRQRGLLLLAALEL